MPTLTRMFFLKLPAVIGKLFGNHQIGTDKGRLFGGNINIEIGIKIVERAHFEAGQIANRIEQRLGCA